jgi:hypothetical protein
MATPTGLDPFEGFAHGYRNGLIALTALLTARDVARSVSMDIALKGNQAAVAAIKDAADRHAADLLPVIHDLRAEGHFSLRQLASALNRRRFRTARGGQWHATSVKNLLARITFEA